MFLTVCVLIAMMFPFSNVQAQAIGDFSGTASVLLLRSDLSPRTAAMSGAFTAIADDEIAILYNPAGLANIKASAFGLSYASWYENVRLSNLLLTYKFDYKLGWALSIGHMGMPDIQGKDAQGNPTSELQVSSAFINFGVGYRITRTFYFGLGVKYFQDRLAEYMADGLALDLGAFLHTSISGLTVGLSLQNLASRYQYDQVKENLPAIFRAGVAFRPPAFKKIIVDADIVRTSDLGWYGVLGAEYTYGQMIFLRLGNRFYTQELFKPTIGIGFKLAGQYQFDYSFMMHEELGMTHRVGFTFRLLPPDLFSSKPKISHLPQEVILRPPSWVKFNLKATEIEINWESVPGVQFNLYARQVNETSWKKINRHLLYSSFHKFKRMKLIKKLIVSVKSVKGPKESAFSKEVTIELK